MVWMRWTVSALVCGLGCGFCFCTLAHVSVVLLCICSCTLVFIYWSCVFFCVWFGVFFVCQRLCFLFVIWICVIVIWICVLLCLSCAGPRPGKLYVECSLKTFFTARNQRLPNKCVCCVRWLRVMCLGARRRLGYTFAFVCLCDYSRCLTRLCSLWLNNYCHNTIYSQDDTWFDSSRKHNKT